MKTLGKYIIGLVVIALLVVGGYALTRKGASPVFGANSPAGNPPSNVTYVSISDLMSLGGDYGSGAVSEKVSTGTCNTASSTLFAVVNPFNATSTVFVQDVFGNGQATTSSLLVGTSTTATGLSATTVSPSLINSSNGISTTTQYFIGSGLTVNLGTGEVSAGANSTRTIVVGPTEFVSAYSTTTATGAGAANYIAGQVCSYKMRWTN